MNKKNKMLCKNKERKQSSKYIYIILTFIFVKRKIEFILDIYIVIDKLV